LSVVFRRVSYRGTLYLFHILVALLVSIFYPFVTGKQWIYSAQGKQFKRWWHRRALDILGIHLTQQGQPTRLTSLVVSNHISFLDISVIASVCDVTFLSKSTLRFWPIIGFVSARMGTVFIPRQNKMHLLNVKYSISEIMQQNMSLVIFPEGTTTLGKTVSRFHSGLLQSAIDTNKPVQPVALSYIRAGKNDRVAAYIDKDNFVTSIIKIMAQPKTNVYISLCESLDSQSKTRHELAATSRHLISNKIHSHQIQTAA